MKRKLVYVAVLASMFIMAGCGKKEKTEPTEVVTEEASTDTVQSTEDSTAIENAEVDYEKVYESVLRHTYDILAASDVPTESVSVEDIGIYEKKKSYPDETALKKIGYTIKDISGDSVPELIIAYNLDGQILAIYTSEDDVPVFVCSGSDKDALSLLKGSNTIYNYEVTSSYTKFGKFHLSENGQNIEWEDCYYSDLSSQFYHNTTGEWDPDSAEKLNVSADEFWSYMVSEDQIKENLDLTLFLYMPGGSVEAPSTTADGVEIVNATGSGVEVRFANFESGELDHCTLMNLSDAENRCELSLFAIDGNLVDINFYKVKCEKSEDGEVLFHADLPYASMPYIKEDEPMVLYIDYPNDSTTTGFSYVDRNGKTTYYVITINDVDGSVVLTPFKPEGF